MNRTKDIERIFGKQPDYIHSYWDRRGNREVYLNGRMMKNVCYADTKAGFIIYYTTPPRISHLKDRIHTLRKSGRVTVKLNETKTKTKGQRPTLRARTYKGSTIKFY